MSGVESIFQQPWVTRAGWTLVHFLWQGSAIAILLAVARELAGPRLTARGRYGLSCAALAMMTAAPLATFLAAGKLDSAALPRPAWPVAGGPTWERLLPWLVLVWLSGVIVFSARVAVGWRMASRLRRAAAGPVPREWQQALDELIRRMRVSAPVRLLASALAPAPAVVGWLRPAILMPIEAMAGLPIEQVRALLAHELAHVLRQDYLVNILQSIAEAALFYHPAVWWVSGQIRTERELCCDDLAVEASGDVLTYATALAELDGRRRSRLGTVLAADGGSLVHRIRRLAGKSEAVSHNLPGPGAVWALAILWLAGIGAVALHAGQRPPAHVALRPFTPVGIAAAPRVMLPAPPLVKGPPAPPMLAALLFDPFFAAPQAPASPVLNPADADRQLAKLTGVVLSSSGPVANATVILPRRYTPGEPIPASGAPVPTTRTDAAGKFSFERLTPGSYTLRATHPAYLPALYGAQTSYAYVGNAFYGAQSSASVGNTSAFVSTGNVLTLTEGQQIAGVTVKLIEPATVSGRVVDEDGDPFVNADIQVLQLVHFNGRPQVSRVSGAASGDDGRFKVEMVPPGKYYLRMGVQPNWTVAERAPVATVKPGQKDLRPNGTYLGGTTEWVGATMIEVEAAQKLAIGDVRILNDTWVHVRGKVIGDPALLEGARVIRMPREPTGRLPWSYGADIQKDGSYDLAHVWSGGFTLTVMKMNGETYGWKPIVVDHEDLAGIVIDAAATQLRGFVRLEGGDQPAPAAGAPSPGRGTVVLTSAEGPTPIRSAAMVKPDGSFAIPVLAPGRYVADVTGLPAGSYLKSIRVGGVDVLNSALDWNGGDNRTLEAVISAKAAVLQGVAQDEDGKPAPGSTVTLVPVPPSFGHSRLYPSATADQQGHFQFPSVCPGTYKVFAWEEIGDTAHWDPEYIKPFESQGESVQLDEGGHATVKPTKISAPAMQEALRKAGQ